MEDISDQLLDHLNTEEALRLMLEANLPGISSAQVQATFLPFATELGFTSEAKGLFLQYENKLRPDYFPGHGTTGILLEVERGKTTTNNMDLLDLWKCHLCKHADYLFLMVPQALKHNDAMTPRRSTRGGEAARDVLRTRQLNQRAGVHIFGY